MDRPGLLAAVIFGTFLLSFVGTRALVSELARHAVLDRPNARSLHEVPTPRGGGIALVGAVLLAWLVLMRAGFAPPGIAPVVVAAALLAVVSWIDDLRDLAPLWRLAAQIAAVALGATALPPVDIPGSILRMLPGGTAAGSLAALALVLAAGLLWIWFVNLFNFMDGIDGLAGSEAAAIGGGLVALAVGGAGIASAAGIAPLAAAILGASVGFLAWNWSPARIFMGDVGSVPLGYLAGFLLLDLAFRGGWLAALILPLYFLADATLTLARRALRGARVWQAHREHYYQRAAQAGLGHAAIVRRVIAADLALVLCGWASQNGAGPAALAGAVAVVAVLLWWLARPRGA